VYSELIYINVFYFTDNMFRLYSEPPSCFSKNDYTEGLKLL